MQLSVREGSYDEDLECKSDDKCLKCQGDCDDDEDCDSDNGFKCFMRYQGEHVPGCDEATPVDPRTDFCYKPAEAKVTAEGNCTAYPCKACQAGCNGNNECEGSLKCMTRTADEAVPGCGTLEAGTTGQNVCAPFEAARELRFFSFSFCTKDEPCPKCRGDCDTDVDCAGNLECFQRSSSNTDDENKVPGCYFEHTDSINSSMDFCFDPNDA